MTILTLHSVDNGSKQVLKQKSWDNRGDSYEEERLMLTLIPLGWQFLFFRDSKEN